MKLHMVLAALLMLAGVAGCDLGMHWITGPMEDRVIRASSGDRFYLELEEGGVESRRWSAKCDDPDVSVSIDHRDSAAKVEIRVHRGFDGPAAVTFRCRQRSGEPPRGFTISLYKRTGDVAFWE